MRPAGKLPFTDTAPSPPSSRASPRDRPRLLRGRGSILLGSGILCLAGCLFLAGYVTWTLWGTGISTAHAQARLRADLDPLLGTRPVGTAPTHGPGRHPVRLGNGIAVLDIPRISLSTVVVEGVGVTSLREGPGHYPETAYPWEAHGRVAIAGHRTSYLHPFWDLDRLRSLDPAMTRMVKELINRASRLSARELLLLAQRLGSIES